MQLLKPDKRTKDRVKIDSDEYEQSWHSLNNTEIELHSVILTIEKELVSLVSCHTSVVYQMNRINKEDPTL